MQSSQLFLCSRLILFVCCVSEHGAFCDYLEGGGRQAWRYRRRGRLCVRPSIIHQAPRNSFHFYRWRGSVLRFYTPPSLAAVCLCREGGAPSRLHHVPGVHPRARVEREDISDTSRRPLHFWNRGRWDAPSKGMLGFAC